MSMAAAVLLLRWKETFLSLKDVEISGWHISNNFLKVKAD